MIKLADATQAQEKKATRAAYGKTLAELYEQGLPIVAVDADLSGSTTTKAFAHAGQEESKRLFNVGIAEQNMIDVAAGLALAGNIAFTGSFAVFGTGRCYDQIRNTGAYANLDVKIAPTHAGISVGPDGGSHPVSYTHRDVYKRQRESRATICSSTVTMSRSVSLPLCEKKLCASICSDASRSKHAIRISRSGQKYANSSAF